MDSLISLEMCDFLKKVYVTNTFPIEGFSPPYAIEKCNTYHHISYDSSLRLFSVCKGKIMDDGYSGNSSDDTYYFRFSDFLPVVGKLMENKSVSIHYHSIYITTNSRYDHTYDFYDEDNIYLLEGDAKGELYIDESYFLHAVYQHDLSLFSKLFHNEWNRIDMGDINLKFEMLRNFGSEAFSRRIAG